MSNNEFDEFLSQAPEAPDIENQDHELNQVDDPEVEAPGTDKKSVGRTNYYEEYVSKQLKQITKWKIDGLSNKQIAVNLGIAEGTFYDYILKHPEFSEAVEKGKIKQILELENAAYKSATGHKVQEKKIEQGADGQTRVTITEKYIPPNPAQNIFMLKNLMPSKYKDRIEQVNTVNVNIRQLQAMSDEELIQLAGNVEIPIDYEIE